MAKKDGERRQNGSAPDPFFYAKDANTIKNMASLPWNDILGESHRLEKLPEITNASDGSMIVPGIMSFRWIPSIGYMAGKKNKVSKASDQLFQSLTQVYTGGELFEGPDYMMLLLAASMVPMLMAHGKKAFGCLRYESDKSQYFGRDLLASMGFDINQWKMAKADFIADYNQIAQQFNDIVALPKDFMISSRWNYISSFIFQDEPENPMAQLAVYTPAKVWIYDDTSMTTGTCLRLVDAMPKADGTSVSLIGPEEFIDLLQSLLTALKGSDQKNMFSLVRRAYSSEQLLKISDLEMNFATPFMYNDVVLAQIHNTNWISNPQWYSANVNSTSGSQLFDVAVYQLGDGSTIESRPFIQNNLKDQTVDLSLFPLTSSRVLDLFHHLESPENVLDITANMLTLSTDGEVKIGALLAARLYTIQCRSEIITDCIFFIGSAVKVLKNSGVVSAYEFDLSKFNYHPLYYVNDATGYNCDNVIGELSYYTIVTGDFLSKLHNRTFFQLLAVPTNSKTVTN